MDVDPDRLRVIAGAVGDASDVLGQTYAARSSTLAPSGAVTATGAALRSATLLWEGLFRRVAGAIDVFGSGLVTAADADVAADQRAKSRMGSVARLVGL